VRLPFTLAAAAVHGGLVAFGFAATLAFGAALAVFAAIALFAVFHGGFHILAFAAGLAVFGFTLVLGATGRGILGTGRGLMAATFAVFHIGHVVMTAPLGLRDRRRVRCCRSCWRLLPPANQRQGKNEDQSKQSEFHKISLSKL